MVTLLIFVTLICLFAGSRLLFINVLIFLIIRVSIFLIIQVETGLMILPFSNAFLLFDNCTAACIFCHIQTKNIFQPVNYSNPMENNECFKSWSLDHIKHVY